MGSRFSDYARRRKFAQYRNGNEDADTVVGYISVVILLWVVVTGLIERAVS